MCEWVVYGGRTYVMDDTRAAVATARTTSNTADRDTTAPSRRVQYVVYPFIHSHDHYASVASTGKVTNNDTAAAAVLAAFYASQRPPQCNVTSENK